MISTRKKIIVIADQLIRSKGYNAFSYADIASTLNMKNAAIHYHFSSKAKLGKAVITESREKFTANRVDWADFTAHEKIDAFVDMYSKNSKNNCICFMGSLGSSYNTLPGEMQDELSLAHKEISNWLVDTLNQGIKSGEFQLNGTPEEITDLITSGLLASLILGRVSEKEVLTNVKKTLLAGLIKTKQTKP